MRRAYCGRMHRHWAKEYSHIPATLSVRDDLRNIMKRNSLQQMPAKVTNGQGRLDQLRGILARMIDGAIDQREAIVAVDQQLPRSSSPHAGENRVFPHGWQERVIRTHFSLLYNQAVLELLAGEGETHCFVGHSSEEELTSPCSVHLAGRVHEIATLHARLLNSYVRNQWTGEPKVPDHPHCTHVVMHVGFAGAASQQPAAP